MILSYVLLYVVDPWLVEGLNVIIALSCCDLMLEQQLIFYGGIKCLMI